MNPPDDSHSELKKDAEALVLNILDVLREEKKKLAGCRAELAACRIELAACKAKLAEREAGHKARLAQIRAQVDCWNRSWFRRAFHRLRLPK